MSAIEVEELKIFWGKKDIMVSINDIDFFNIGRFQYFAHIIFEHNTHMHDARGNILVGMAIHITPDTKIVVDGIKGPLFKALGSIDVKAGQYKEA